MKRSALIQLWLPSALLVAVMLLWRKQEALGTYLVSAGVGGGAAVSGYAAATALWIAGAIFLNRLLGLAMMSGFVTRLRGRPYPRILKDMLSVFIVLVTLSGIIGFVFKQSVTGLWATSGAIGIIVGFALRPIILDIFSGVAVNIENPFRIGDWVVIESGQAKATIAGWVDQVNWRTTQIRTREGNLVIIPNSLLGTSVVTNFSAPEGHSRFEISVRLDFEVPADRASRVIIAGACEVLGIAHGPMAEPAPEVLVGTVTSEGVEYRLRYWFDARKTSEPQVRNVVTRSVLRHLAMAGIHPAYHKQDVFHAPMVVVEKHLDSPEYLAGLLRIVSLFADLQSGELSQLAGASTVRRFPSGAVLVRETDPGSSMFVLVEGLLKVSVRSEDGAPREVARLGPGEFFGEMSLLTGEPRSATVAAACDSVVAEITKLQIEGLLRSRPEVAGQITHTVVERRLQMTQALADIAEEHREQHRASLASQVLAKMKAFFNIE